MLSNPPAERMRTPIPRPQSPIFFVVVLGVASFAAHHVHDGFRVTLVAGTERGGESFRDNPHHRALFRIERASEISQPFHRDTNRGDRAWHVAPLAARRPVAQSLRPTSKR